MIFSGFLGTLKGGARQKAKRGSPEGVWAHLTAEGTGCVSVVLRPATGPTDPPTVCISFDPWQEGGPESRIVLFEGPIPRREFPHKSLP